jgi:hypothetical protein
MQIIYKHRRMPADWMLEYTYLRNAPDRMVIMNYEVGRIWKETAMAYLLRYILAFAWWDCRN